MSSTSSSSSSGSSSGSTATSPRELDIVASDSPVHSSSRVPSPVLRNENANPSLVVVDPDDVPLQVKYQSMISKEPWSAIVSNVRIPIAKIKERYHIPHDYEVIIPRQFDRMHRPAKLLVEEVLRLAGLSSSPLCVRGSLGDFLILNLQFILKYVLYLMYSFAGKKVMKARIANKVRAKKRMLPENVLLELENPTGDSSTPSKRTPNHATSTPVVAALEGPSSENVLEVSEAPSLQVGALEAVQGELSRPYKKRKHKSKSRSKSRSKSKSRSSRSSKFDKQRRLEARLAADREKEDDHVKTLEEQEAQWKSDRTNLRSPTLLVAEMVGEKLVP
ncbi:UNVERIFIED_CONTAM: hypothetical protein Slati_4410800 [Sesamum latifolium]|uniref:Uncharacterized protein n=1 Tax=Sesamum latifolium TaxID=2727402 RepID=A0AAW2SPJ6_9LAMI